MGVLSFLKKDKGKNDSIVNSLEKIRTENPRLRQKFIEENMAFIMKTISQALGKSVVIKNSEEFSIGLSAFNYSIDNFDLKSGEDFFIYSEKIIKKQIYDYSFQCFKNLKKQTSTYYNKEETNPYANVEDFEEIALFKQSLWKYGITLKELSLVTPKNPKIVKLLMNVAKSISRSDELFNKLNSTRNVSMDGLDEELKLHKAAIKKYKEYIYAVCLIMKSKLEILKSYIKNYEMELELYKNIGTVLELSDGMAVVFTDKCRFVVIKNSNHLSVGYEVKSRVLNKNKYFGSFIKFSIIVTVFTISVSALFMSVKNLDLNGIPGFKPSENKQVYVNSSKKNKKPNNESNTEKQNNTANLNKNSNTAENTTPTEVAPTLKTENDKNEMPTSPIKNILVQESTPVPVINYNTPVYPAAAGSGRTIPPPALPTSTFEIKPTPRMGSVFYPTVKATGAPAKPRISSDLYEVKVGEEFTITMNTYGGNNGTKWKLYENDIAISTIHCEDNTPNDQKMSRLITPKKAGTYTYRCELINDLGTSGSISIYVVVKQ